MAVGDRAASHSPVAEGALSPDAVALQVLLQEVLAAYKFESGAAVDIPTIQVAPEDVPAVCAIIKDDPRLSFKVLLCMSGVDYKEYIQMVYVLLSLDQRHKLIIKTDLSYDNLEIATLTPVWRAADWYERETHDLFGVTFADHPNLQPLLLYEGFEGYPGRKEHPFHDYQEF